jgi:hypothetical protein
MNQTTTLLPGCMLPGRPRRKAEITLTEIKMALNECLKEIEQLRDQDDRISLRRMKSLESTCRIYRFMMEEKTNRNK